MKLNQILAIEANKKKHHHEAISDLHKATQKEVLMNGFHRVYEPKDEDGESLPPESQKVQFKYKEVIEQMTEKLVELIDLTATKDWSNCEAKADVVVEGSVFLEQVPVPHLLFLEKQLEDMRTFVAKMVELDPGENWTWDANSGQFKSDVVEQTKKQKQKRPIVLYDATTEHPAQTQLIEDDVIVGTWKKTKFSGAIPGPEKKKLMARIQQLSEAVKFAREHANSTDATEKKVGKKVLGYIFEEVEA